MLIVVRCGCMLLCVVYCCWLFVVCFCVWIDCWMWVVVRRALLVFCLLLVDCSVVLVALSVVGYCAVLLFEVCCFFFHVGCLMRVNW